MRPNLSSVLMPETLMIIVKSNLSLNNPPASEIIVVTPVYEDAEAFVQLLAALADLYGRSMLVIAIDDGSLRKPIDRTHLNSGIATAIVRLKCNVGHQRALAIGLAYAVAIVRDDQQIIMMDCDGEDAPETIEKLRSAAKEDAIDVVVAERKSRVESWRFKLFYAIYRQFFRVLTGRNLSFGNFMLLTPSAAKRIACMKELSIHVAGCVLASKLRAKRLRLDRGARFAGQSKMNFFSLALHGFRGLMVFAEDVLVRVGAACALIALLSIIGAAAAVVLKLLGYSTPGWFSVALGILVLMFMQTDAITLMTLMLTGVVRSGNASHRLDFEELVDEVIESSNADNLR